MRQKKGRKRANPQDHMPDATRVAAELAKAKSMDDFFGKDGIFAKLFADTLEQMMEEELTDHLGYEPYEAKGRNSGNSRNGYYNKKVRTSAGDTDVRVPRILGQMRVDIFGTSNSVICEDEAGGGTRWHRHSREARESSRPRPMIS